MKFGNMGNIQLFACLCMVLIWHSAAQKTVITEHEECGEREIDLAFIVDSSGSIGSSDFRLMRKFLVDFIDDNAINAGSVRVALVSFSSYAKVEFHFNTYDKTAAIQNAIRKMTYMSRATNITGALRLTREDIFHTDNGDRPEVSDLVIIATDGESNIEAGPQMRRELRKWKGPNTKQTRIFGIGIGPAFERSGNQEELRKIVTDGMVNDENLNFVKSYDELDKLRAEIFKKICKVIEKVSTVKDGDPCYQEGQVVNSRCKRFTCQGGFWFRAWTGCLFNGCMEWGEEKMDGCNRYKCFRKSECLDEDRTVCLDFDVKLTNVGCMVKGTCRDEDTTWNDDKACEAYTCKRGKDQDRNPIGEVGMTDSGCIDPEGVCRAIGYKYSDHCIGFKCERVEENGQSVVKFVTYEAGCKNGDKCVLLGDAIKEDCNELVCTYDDSTQLYDFVIDTIQCDFDGKCHELDTVWENEDTCTKFKCFFNENTKKAVVRERVSGCKVDGGCVPKGGAVGKAKCIEYKCNPKGGFDLVTAGCPVGDECKPLNSTWRNDGVCAQFYCREGEYEEGYITTTKIKEIECHDFKGNCMKEGDTTVDNCLTYECGPGGKLRRTDAECKYKGVCYKIGQKWEDRDTCKEYRCNADPTEGAVYFGLSNGCVDEMGVCYKPGESRTMPDCCLTEICGVDHVFRANLCVYKSTCYEIDQEWTDYDDCLTFFCKEDPITATAVMEEIPYGCLYKKKCYAPGDRITKGCETFECMSEGRGFQAIDEECPWEDGCRAVGSKWFSKDECVQYGCVEKEDGVSVEEIIHGCEDEYRERCWRSGAKVVEGNGCIQFKCVNGTMEPLSIGCPHGDTCMEVGQVIKDDKACIRYECVVEEQGAGYIKTTKKERPGCLDHETCYWRGQTKTEACVTYKCFKKGFRIVDARCEFRGICKSMNSRWEHNKKCMTFSCTKKGDAEIPRVTRNLWGCKDEQGRCHKFGAQKKINNCVTYECERRRGYGAKFFPKDIGCPFRKKCKAVNEEWIHRNKCVRQTCLYSEGLDLPEIQSSPYGCRTGGTCYPFGDRITDDENECVKYECTKYEIFTPVETGCMYGGVCKRDRARWVDRTACIRYKCKSEAVSPSQVIMHTSEEKGCKDFDGNCMWPGDTVVKDCTTYLCDPTRDTLVIIKEDCQDGDECRPLNSTWFDPESCTDFRCIYSPVLKDIIIDAKTTGCKNDDGRCFQKGEKKEDGCNKFLCNKYSNFKPVEVGCKWRKRCYKVGESWEKNCVVYTCELVSQGINFVETHVNASHGCLDDDGGCYKPGDKRTEGCLQYVCREGGEFEVSKFACTTDEGCLKPGDFYLDKKECVEYKCSRRTRSLEPVNRSCKWKGECIEQDAKWFDKETCQGFKCAYSPAENDVKVVERTAGCRDDEGQCKRSGTQLATTNKCVKFKCQNGEFIPTDVGCEWDGKCAPYGSSWLEDCVQYTCQIEEQGPTFIETTVVAHHGCHDCSGACYMPGEIVNQGCSVRECMWGGYFQNVEVGCMSKTGECVAIGEIVDYGVRKQVCGDDGYLTPVDPPTGCYDGKYNFYPLGEYMDQDCEKFQCQQRGYMANFYLIEKGCLYNGKCHGVGESWSELDTCRYFYCTSQQSGVGVVESIVKELDGCWDDRNEKCREHESTWYEGCFEKQCIVTKTRNKSVMKKIVLLSGGCEQIVGDNKICHGPGEIWSENREDMCLQLKCEVRKNVYNSKIFKPLCRDINGQCHEIGDIGFDAKINGELLHDCKCVLRSKQLRYICKG